MTAEETSIPQLKTRSLKGQIVTDVGRFSLASVVAQICVFFKGYFGAYLVGPTIWGVWHTALLIQNYGAFTGLGVGNAMHREIPILRGKGEVEESPKIKDTAFSYNLFAGILTFAAIFLSTFFLKVSQELLLSLRFVSIIIFLNSIAGFYNVLFKANNQFNVVSRITIIQGIPSLLTIPLIFLFSFSGFLVGQVLIALTAVGYSIVNYKEKIHLKIDMSILKKLIIIGLPITLLGLAGFLFITVDRLLIVNILGFENLGFYSIASTFFTPIMLICTSVNSVMYPRLGEKFGSDRDTRNLRKYIEMPIKEISLFAPIIIGAICVLLSSLVNILLPEYIDGILAAQILIFGFFFLAVEGMAGNFFLVTNRQLLYLIILLFSCFVNFIISFAMIKLGFGISGVALGTSLSYFIFFLIMVVLAMKYCYASRIDIIRLIFSILLRVSIIAAIAFLTNYINFGFSSILEQIYGALIRIVVYLVLSSFLIYKAFNDSEVVSIVRERFKKRKRREDEF